MNRLLQRFFLFLGLAGLLVSSCRPVPEPIKTVPPTDKKLTIERLEAAGIPPENITIDQIRHEITVLIPPSPGYASPLVSYTLGCADCLIYCKTCAGPTGKTITDKDYLSFCLSPDRQGWRVTTTDGRYQGPPYQVVFKTTGDLQVDPAVASITHFPEDNYFTIPVLNFYDSLYNGTVLIRRKATETVIATSHISCNNSGQPTEFIVPLQAGQLPLGEYTVEITKANGRRTASPFPLVVRRGKITLHGSLPDLSRDKERMHFGGYNLYPEDNLELLIENQTYSARLKPYNFTPDGQSFTVNTPPDLVPGYYSILILQNGQAIRPYGGGRTIIVANQAQPFLYYIALSPDPEPGIVSLKRGQLYPLDLSRNGSSDTRTSLKLVSVTNPSRQYVVPVTHSTHYFLSSEGEFAKTIISTAVPAGRYQITPRFQTAGVLIEGLPYGWSIDVL